MNRCEKWLTKTCAVSLVVLSAIPAPLAHAQTPRRPAVLIHAPRGQGSILGVDADFLKELYAAGLEVDYTDHHREFTWERIKNYNVLVLYTCPPPQGERISNASASEAPFQKEFVEMVEQFLAEGGGVFLMAYVRNTNYQFVKPLLDNWDGAIPIQWIRETDEAKLGRLTRATRVPLAFTSEVFESPVSEGVRQIWYPASYRPHYYAGDTNPLVLGPQWTVVIRASKTSQSVLVDMTAKGFNPPANITKRHPEVDNPPIFGVRPYKRGRVALASMLPVFTFGSGKQWIFDSQVLTRGCNDSSSHMQKLIENTLKWLGQPSLESETIGGYTTDPKRLLYVNQRPEIKKRFKERFWSETELDYHRPVRGKLFKGLIGAKTTISGAEGTPADYARAAKEAKLDFVVILEDFDKLTEEKFEALRKACHEASDNSMQIIPGYTIVNTVGNHVLVYGSLTPWPREELRYGPDKTLLMQQAIDTQGNYQRISPVLMWVLHDLQQRTFSQLGYFNFKDSPRGFRMEHGRTYGMGVIWLYEDGKLVEDATDHYLGTSQGCVPPGPGAVNIVRSPAELEREAAARRGLVYGQARSLATLQQDALSYWSMKTYDAPNMFSTTGPVIHAWPECFRVHTFAVEDFVTGRNLMPAPIHVTSDVGLKEIRIYDGTMLFRRIALDGVKQFKENLVLDGTVQRNLVLIAEDGGGGKAVSYARRTRKCGDVWEYCGDRVNIGDMFMFHGPGNIRVLDVPEIYGGYTWDGGPKGVAPLFSSVGSHPELTAAEGSEGKYFHNQYPMLLCSDEGMRGMFGVRDQVLPEYAFHQGMSPWGTYGPWVEPKLFTHIQHYTEWHREAWKVRPAGPPSYGFGYGAVPTLFSTTLTFVRDQDIQDIKTITFSAGDPEANRHVVVGIGDRVEVIPADKTKKTARVLAPGDWFGAWSPGSANACFFTVRDVTVRLDLHGRNSRLALHAKPADPKVKMGDSFTYGLATMTFPVDAEINTSQQVVQRKHYLENPTGLKVTGARRLDSPGLLDYQAAAAHRVEIELPCPEWKTLMTLPLRFAGFNWRWSAGLFMRRGYVAGNYGKGENRYRPLGIDPQGRVYLPISPDLAPVHHYIAGHPVVAEGNGAEELFIQVTQISGGTFMPDKKSIQPFRWHVSVNNPLDRAATVTLTKNMELPGFDFPEQTLTLAAGEYRVLMQ